MKGRIINICRKLKLLLAFEYARQSEKQKTIKKEFSVWKDNYLSGDNQLFWDGVLCENRDQLHIGINSAIQRSCFIFLHWAEDNCQNYNEEKKRGKLVIGNNVRIGPDVRIDAYALVEIGDNCLFGSEINILTALHGMNPEISESYLSQGSTIKSVIIGKGCWIGDRVTILPGASIGDRCIIGANAVVTGSIPSYSIAVGVPARVIKKWNFETHIWEKIV